MINEILIETRSRIPFFEIARNIIKPDDKVLDIGAGDGCFSRYCKRNDFYLVDGNEITIQKHKDEFPNYIYSKLPTLPFDDNMFDLIHVSHVLEHLDNQEFYETIKEINRCLKYSGHLVISMPLLSDFFYDDLSHIKPYNPAIFFKYLTKDTVNNLSRSKISEEYEIIQLQHRYDGKKLLEFPQVQGMIHFWILNKFFGGLRRIGFKKYVKTGYTIVLKKA